DKNLRKKIDKKKTKNKKKQRDYKQSNLLIE
ncbi:uncharacterized protein METZ01_LOCUS367354, partial [marine metagenome]